jgi:excinuclease UvrABC nuclease subunit
LALKAPGARRWFTPTPGRVPPAPGLYALFSGEQLLYLGSSVNLRDRLTDHGVGRSWKRPPGRFTAVRRLRVRIALEPRRGRWLMREWRLIDRLRPPMNSAGTGPGRRRRSHRSREQ